MHIMTLCAIVVTMIGSALIGGIFFAFSSFIIKALARMPSTEGIAAMQSINVTVLNPTFLGAFLGTAAISLVIAVLAVLGWEMSSAPWFIAGGVLYLIGTFLVTGLGNVPLNNQLAAVNANAPTAIKVWEYYLERWTLLNSIRTTAAICAAQMFATGLIQYGS